MSEKIKIILESGHWISSFADPGAVCNNIHSIYYKRREANDVYELTHLVADSLLQYTEFEPILLKDRYSYSNTTEKFKIVNSLGGQAYISFHRNAFTNPKDCDSAAYGYETYIQSVPTNKDSKFADCIHKAIIAVGVSGNRGIKKSNFEVCTKPNMPSILTELLFIDNTSDNKMYDIKKNSYAQGYVKGICQYFNVAYIEPQNKPILSEEVYRIRIAWVDSQSQIGAYNSLDNAIAMCKDGYKVFDSSGNMVYIPQRDIECNHSIFEDKISALEAAQNITKKENELYKLENEKLKNTMNEVKKILLGF